MTSDLGCRALFPCLSGLRETSPRHSHDLPAASQPMEDCSPRLWPPCNRFCGCRPKCKEFLTLKVCDRVRTSVRPFNATFPEAAGRYGDQRVRSKSNLRAFCSQRLTGFPDPDLFDHFAHSCHRLLTLSWPRSLQSYMSIMPSPQVPDPCSLRAS